MPQHHSQKIYDMHEYVILCAQTLYQLSVSQVCFWWCLGVTIFYADFDASCLWQFNPASYEIGTWVE